MAKMMVALPDRQAARQLAQGLEAAGIPVFRTCVTGNDVMQAFNLCEDGVLVCGTRFPDRTADQLAYDLGARALILVVGKPEQLENCEHPALYKLQAPFSMRELAASVQMLLQMHGKLLPHRTGGDKECVEQAKAALMRQHGLSEPEAHRLLQKESMRSGETMLRCAQRILKKNG